MSNPVSPCFQSYNFSQILNEPTRITGRTSTLIDPIFITSNDIVQTRGTLHSDNIFDHMMVYRKISLKRKKMQPKFVSFRCFKDFDRKLLIKLIIGLPWFGRKKGLPEYSM